MLDSTLLGSILGSDGLFHRYCIDRWLQTLRVDGPHGTELVPISGITGITRGQDLPPTTTSSLRLWALGTFRF